MKLIYLEWEDAVTNNLRWFGEEEARKWGKKQTIIVKECGWILEENKRYLVLVNRQSEASFDEAKELDVGGLHKIPKTWIRKRKIIDL